MGELEQSTASRKRAREIVQEIRCLQEQQSGLTELIQAIREFRDLADQPLTLRGSDHAHAVQELNKAIDRGEGLLQ